MYSSYRLCYTSKLRVGLREGSHRFDPSLDCARLAKYASHEQSGAEFSRVNSRTSRKSRTSGCDPETICGSMLEFGIPCCGGPSAIPSQWGSLSGVETSVPEASPAPSDSQNCSVRAVLDEPVGDQTWYRFVELPASHRSAEPGLPKSMTEKPGWRNHAASGGCGKSFISPIFI